MFALSFYKTEFEIENSNYGPNFEVVNVYNVFVVRKFTHLFQNPKSHFAVAARELYVKYYRKFIQQEQEKSETQNMSYRDLGIAEGLTSDRQL